VFLRFSLLNAIKEALFPLSCAFCGEQVECCDALCPKCWLSVNFINRNTCKYCGAATNDELQQQKYNPHPSFQCCYSCAKIAKAQPEQNEILASVLYDNFIKKFILKFKNKKEIRLANLFAKLFHKEDFQGVDYVIPVPIHPKKLYKRTYNQAALLVFALQRLYDDFPAVELNLLKKTRFTGSQKGKNMLERRKNIAGSFVVTEAGKKLIPGKIIAVVDDVAASGATLLECRRELRKAGANEVRCVALARSLPVPRR
jgi:ComF family protein